MTTTTTTKRAGQSHKSIEEILAYAISHRIRVYVLTLLNEGVYSPEEIAQIIGEPSNKVSNHIRELLDAGSIELVKSEPVRNTTKHYYRAVEMPIYDEAEMAAMTPEQRQVTIGLTLQCLTAEFMSAFWAGKMASDPQLWVSWRWFNVDELGRHEIADWQSRSWERFQEIEADSTNRRAKSGEPATSIVAAQLGFERERTAPSPPATETPRSANGD